MTYQDRVDAVANQASQTTTDASRGAAHATDRLRTDKDAIRRDVLDRGREFSEQAAESLGKVGIDASRARAALVDFARAVGGDLRVMCQERPMRSLCAAVGVGLLVGLFVGR